MPQDFPPEVHTEAKAAARQPPAGERIDLPFVTIDPPGARDLDQAMHIERRGDGHRVYYAIADVGAFVTPGGPLDRDTHARGVTIYAPDAKTPLHPPALSEGAGSLLPGQWRPAVLWTLDLDGTGELTTTDVARAQVRSVAQYTYDDVPADREARCARSASAGWRSSGRAAAYASPFRSRRWSRRTAAGRCATGRRFRARSSTRRSRCSRAWRPPPSCSAPAAESCGRSRGRTKARSSDCGARPRRSASTGRPAPPTPSSSAGSTRRRPRHAALLHEATGVGGAAGYTAFDGAPPADAAHFAVAAPYAHATAPLRRLQDRYVSECCLAAAAGTSPPQWVRAGLAEAAGGDDGGSAAGAHGGAGRRRPRRSRSARRAGG